jgi:hypothetical protein
MLADVSMEVFNPSVTHANAIALDAIPAHPERSVCQRDRLADIA